MAERDGTIDFAKGCAIVSMVVGHVWGGAADAFVNLYHMSFFLMASGLFFDGEKVAAGMGVVSFVKSRVRRLYLPFVFWTFAFLCLNNLFLDIHFLADAVKHAETDVGQSLALSSYMNWWDVLVRLPKVLVMKDWTRHTGPCWFLITLLYVSVGYGAVTWLLSRVSRRVLLYQTVLAGGLVVLAQFVSGHSFLGVRIGVGGRNFAAYALFHTGVLLRHVDWRKLLDGRIKSASVFCLALGLLSLLDFLGCRICLSRNQFDCVGVLLTAAMCGFAFLTSAAILVAGVSRGLSGVVQNVGRRTMPILIFHWTAISLVNLVGVTSSHLPLERIAFLPGAFEGNGYRFACLLCGIGIPMLLGEAYRRLRRLWYCKVFGK